MKKTKTTPETANTQAAPAPTEAATPEQARSLWRVCPIAVKAKRWQDGTDVDVLLLFGPNLGEALMDYTRRMADVPGKVRPKTWSAIAKTDPIWRAYENANALIPVVQSIPGPDGKPAPGGLLTRVWVGEAAEAVMFGKTIRV
jgi:hypothetical protein